MIFVIHKMPVQVTYKDIPETLPSQLVLDILVLLFVLFCLQQSKLAK